MNNATRKIIAELGNFTSTDRESLEAELDNVIDQLTSFSEEEREKFDNLPESWQQGEKGEKFTECADALDDAVSVLESLRDRVQNDDEFTSEEDEEEFDEDSVEVPEDATDATRDALIAEARREFENERDARREEFVSGVVADIVSEATSAVEDCLGSL